MPADTRARREQLRRRCDAEIARHYRQRLTLAELAGRLGTSPRALQRAYADAGTTTVAERLRDARLRAGAELLSTQPIAVADVGRIVGFRSASAFTLAFMRRYGLTPARFRAAARAARGPPAVTRPPTTATARGS
jgi:AraC-like DNA-binding protein